MFETWKDRVNLWKYAAIGITTIVGLVAIWVMLHSRRPTEAPQSVSSETIAPAPSPATQPTSSSQSTAQSGSSVSETHADSPAEDREASSPTCFKNPVLGAMYSADVASRIALATKIDQKTDAGVDARVWGDEEQHLVFVSKNTDLLWQAYVVVKQSEKVQDIICANQFDDIEFDLLDDSGKPTVTKIIQPDPGKAAEYLQNRIKLDNGS